MNPQSSLSQITSQVLYPLVQAAETKDAKIVKVGYYYYFCCHYCNITTNTVVYYYYYCNYHYYCTTIMIMCVWQCVMAVRPIGCT